MVFFMVFSCVLCSKGGGLASAHVRDASLAGLELAGTTVFGDMRKRVEKVVLIVFRDVVG